MAAATCGAAEGERNGLYRPRSFVVWQGAPGGEGGNLRTSSCLTRQDLLNSKTGQLVVSAKLPKQEGEGNISR